MLGVALHPDERLRHIGRINRLVLVENLSRDQSVPGLFKIQHPLVAGRVLVVVRELSADTKLGNVRPSIVAEDHAKILRLPNFGELEPQLLPFGLSQAHDFPHCSLLSQLYLNASVFRGISG